MGKALAVHGEKKKKKGYFVCADGFQQRAISTPQLLLNNQYVISRLG